MIAQMIGMEQTRAIIFDQPFQDYLQPDQEQYPDLTRQVIQDEAERYRMSLRMRAGVILLVGVVALGASGCASVAPNAAAPNTTQSQAPDTGAGSGAENAATHSGGLIPLRAGGLYRGLRGQDVKQRQIMLAKIGCHPGDPDKIYGPRVTKAFRSFQRNKDLLVDGIDGRHTDRALIKSVKAKDTYCGANQPPIKKPVSLPGCAGTAGPAVPGTLCPEGNIASTDSKLAMGCPGSSVKINASEFTSKCPARPGRVACVYKAATKICDAARVYYQEISQDVWLKKYKP